MIEKEGGVFMDRVSAMQARHSVRKYTDQALEPGQAQLLEARMEDINQQEGLNFRLILGEDQFFKGESPVLEILKMSKTILSWLEKKTWPPKK